MKRLIAKLARSIFGENKPSSQQIDDDFLKPRDAVLQRIAEHLPEDKLEIFQSNSISYNAFIEIRRFSLPIARIVIADSLDRFEYKDLRSESLETAFSSMDDLTNFLDREVSKIITLDLAPPLEAVESYIGNVYAEINQSPICQNLESILKRYQLKTLDYGHLLALHVHREEYSAHKVPTTIIDLAMYLIARGIPTRCERVDRLVKESLHVRQAFLKAERLDTFESSPEVRDTPEYQELDKRLAPILLLPYTKIGKQMGIDDLSCIRRRDALVRYLPVCREVAELNYSRGLSYSPELWFADTSDLEAKLLSTDEDIQPIYQKIYDDPKLKIIS